MQLLDNSTRILLAIAHEIMGVTTQEEALKIIGEIRDELCSGSISLQDTVNPCPGYTL